MLIRTLTRAAGRLNFRPGQIIEIDAGDARELIAAGAAEVAEIMHKEPAPTEPPVPASLPELIHAEQTTGPATLPAPGVPVRRGRGRPPKIRE